MQFFDICAKFGQILLPQHCLLCGTASADQTLCSSCLQDLPQLPEAHCPVCALPSPQGQICGECLRELPAFDATVAATAYAYPSDALIRALKYREQLQISTLLADLLYEKLAGQAMPDFVIPVPLHPARLQSRGFNQATEIARLLGRRLDIPCLEDIAKRIRATEPQAGLPLEKRRKNMKGAFAVSADLKGKHVALVDDVMTTGASLSELAKVLKAAGAVRVECWVAARTLRE